MKSHTITWLEGAYEERAEKIKVEGLKFWQSLTPENRKQMYFQEYDTDPPSGQFKLGVENSEWNPYFRKCQADADPSAHPFTQEERQRLTMLFRVLLIITTLNTIVLTLVAWSQRLDSDKLEARIKVLEAQAATPHQ